MERKFKVDNTCDSQITEQNEFIESKVDEYCHSIEVDPKHVDNFHYTNDAVVTVKFKEEVLPGIKEVWKRSFQSCFPIITKQFGDLYCGRPNTVEHDIAMGLLEEQGHLYLDNDDNEVFKAVLGDDGSLTITPHLQEEIGLYHLEKVRAEIMDALLSSMTYWELAKKLGMDTSKIDSAIPQPWADNMKEKTGFYPVGIAWNYEKSPAFGEPINMPMKVLEFIFEKLRQAERGF